MPELVDPVDDLHVELEQLRRSESQLKERQVVLLRSLKYLSHNRNR